MHTEMAYPPANGDPSMSIKINILPLSHYDVRKSFLCEISAVQFVR